MNGPEISKLPGLHRSAIFSEDLVYRYTLARQWGESKSLNVIMLNPSVADQYRDDNTIRKVMGFADREGFQNLVITNIFGLRATGPHDLLTVPDPIGEKNDFYVEGVAAMSDQVWVAWGNWRNQRSLNRAFRVQELLHRAGKTKVYCLGHNHEGSPKHPLYLPNSTALIPWEGYY